MKLTFLPDFEESQRRTRLRASTRRYHRSCWHEWFAWFPVKVGTEDFRWLEVVQRSEEYKSRQRGGFYFWVYRSLPSNNA